MNDNKAPNPFNPNSVVSERLFAGRSTQVAEILRKLTLVKDGMPSSFFFVGERGIGKTALSRLVKYIAQDRDAELFNLNLLTSYYSAEKGQDTKDVLQAILNELTDVMPTSLIEKLSQRLGDLFNNGKFAIGAFGLSVEASGLLESKRETTVRDQIVSILANIIDGIRSDTENPKDGILFIIDELDNVSDVEVCAQLIRGIVTTLNVKDKGHIAFILIGYKNTEMRFFAGDQSTRRHFDEIPLEPMPNNEAAEILKKGFKSVKVEWDEEILQGKIAMTGGFPHSIQVLGHNLFEVDTDNFIDHRDWNLAVGRTALQLQSKEFSSMYNFQGKRGFRETLLDFLINNDGISKGELSKKFSDKNCYRTLKMLREQGSVSEDENEAQHISTQLLRVAILFSNFDRLESHTDQKNELD